MTRALLVDSFCRGITFLPVEKFILNQGLTSVGIYIAYFFDSELGGYEFFSQCGFNNIFCVKRS